MSLIRCGIDVASSSILVPNKDDFISCNTSNNQVNAGNSSTHTIDLQSTVTLYNCTGYNTAAFNISAAGIVYGIDENGVHEISFDGLNGDISNYDYILCYSSAGRTLTLS